MVIDISPRIIFLGELSWRKCVFKCFEVVQVIWIPPVDYKYSKGCESSNFFLVSIFFLPMFYGIGQEKKISEVHILKKKKANKKNLDWLSFCLACSYFLSSVLSSGLSSQPSFHAYLLMSHSSFVSCLCIAIPQERLDRAKNRKSLLVLLCYFVWTSMTLPQ